MLRLFIFLFCNLFLIDSELVEQLKLEKYKTAENKTLEIPHLRLNDTVWDDIHYQWYEQALGGLFVAFSKRLKSKITDTNQLNDFDSCSKDLSNVHKYAECMSILMNSQMKRENEEITRNIGSFVLLGRKKRKTLEEAQMELLSEETLKMQNASNPSLAKFLTNLLLPIARPNRTLAQDYLTSVQKRLPNAGDTEFSHDSDEFESVNFLNTPYSYQFKRPIESLEAVLDEFFSVYKNFDQANGAQFSQELMQNIKIAVREASRIGVTDPNDANVKHILSPSLFSITKDEVSPKDKFLSPTLLSLQNDSNAILSIPQLLQQNGLEKDKDVWMDFIMEATGSNDIMKSIHKLDRQIARQNIRTTREIPDDIQKNYTKQAENFFNLKKNLTEKQLQMYKEFGYAFLEEHQIDFIYGPDSKERREILHFDVKNFTQLTENEKEETLRREIMEFVNVKPKVRTKRAPIIATAIIGRTLVGPRLQSPVILSPVLISASVLAPSILGPIILSPIVLYAIILSPRILSPIILSPIVGLPVILSPVILGPRILSPTELFPVVLCPFILSPIIVAPGQLAVVILSPRLLTPYILSPLDLVGVVLAPRVLSPLVKTRVTNAVVVLSPNLLSRKKRRTRAKRFWSKKSSRRIEKFWHND